MKTVSSAFTLIELMSYIFCTTVMCLFLFSWSSGLYHDLFKSKRLLYQKLQTHLAIDVITRDLRSAVLSDREFFPSSFLFKKQYLSPRGGFEQCWVSYETTPKGLRRSQGRVYNSENKRFLKRAVSYLPVNFQKLALKKIASDHVEIMYQAYGVHGTRVVSCLNGGGYEA